MVRRIFALALEGERGVPPGVERIAERLNREAPAFRNGRPWSTAC